jgi:hypothetical protein
MVPFSFPCLIERNVMLVKKTSSSSAPIWSFSLHPIFPAVPRVVLLFAQLTLTLSPSVNFDSTQWSTAEKVNWEHFIFPMTKCYDIESHSQSVVDIQLLLRVHYTKRSTPPFPNETLNMRSNICLSQFDWKSTSNWALETCKTKPSMLVEYCFD